MNELKYKQQAQSTFDRWPNRILVVAGTYQQARDWARMNECPRQTWRYVSYIYDIYGLNGGWDVVFYGTWWRKEDILEIEAYIAKMVKLGRLKIYGKDESKKVEKAKRRDIYDWVDFFFEKLNNFCIWLDGIMHGRGQNW